MATAVVSPRFGLHVQYRRSPAAVDSRVRLLIAQAVGTPVVPVSIVDEPAGLSAAERTNDQINFNERRIPR
ncbi:hypothetical protein F5X71_14725 [Nocardia brasiliensis]|uniref:Uncharacterized protein n=1 Tax=Nocardia brasiliensis TaxID=37326 RepID=A0A6G9XR69_NOCBR|nr:hypothetical protein [Nocardia brasiliensis]QIS03408.1 hypothetical protein F5X71_14725 [Nocardia brasiliensis]